jgi:hypothetical protein
VACDFEGSPAVGPGAIAFTRIPKIPSSLASARVSWFTPAFAAL